MKNHGLFLQYGKFEDSLIQSFHRHPFLENFARHSNEVIVQFLLQLGYLSAEFVKWYERAKLGFVSVEAKEVVRRILRDEIPVDAPTHQDERLYDLVRMGVPKESVLNTAASRRTRATVRRLYQLVRYPQADYDLRVLVTLRIFGEILVAETYGYVVRSLPERFGLTIEQSGFYAPHFHHDAKNGVGDGHTDAFDALLLRLIGNEQQLAVAKDAAQKAFAARRAFHDQFTPRYRVAAAFRRVAALAAGVALAAFLGLSTLDLCEKAGREESRHTWAAFLTSLPSEARAFYLNCDRKMVQAALKTGRLAYLQTVGTAEACRECWGEGP